MTLGENKNSGVSGGVTAVTSTVGNGVGGLLGTVGGVVGATGRGGMSLCLPPSLSPLYIVCVISLCCLSDFLPLPQLFSTSFHPLFNLSLPPVSHFLSLHSHQPPTTISPNPTPQSDLRTRPSNRVQTQR